MRGQQVASTDACCSGGHEAVAQLLLQHGADVAAGCFSKRAAWGGQRWHGADATAALMCAAQGGHEAVAQLLLQHGADARAAKHNGGTALMLAAQGGHEAVAQLLLQHGADARAAEDDGSTALMCAALGGHEAVAQLLLLQHGADASGQQVTMAMVPQH